MVRFLGIVAFIAQVVLCADEPRIVRNGKAQSVRADPTLVTNVIRFLASSSHQSTGYAVKSNTWSELLESDSYVYVKLEPPRVLNLRGMQPGDLKKLPVREEVVINEIIVPLPEEHGPLHIYARSGTNTVSHTKFNPMIFKELIQEPALKLRGTKVYKEYSRLPSGPVGP